MKRIRYESDTMVPAEIESMIKTMQHRILRDNLEPDKIICNIESFRGSIIRWFASNQAQGE